MTAPLLVVGLFAIVAALIAWSRWLTGRRWAAAGNLLLAVVAGVVAGIGWPAARHLETYEKLTHGRAVASIYVERAGAGRQRISLTRLPSGRMQVFEVAGDEWRLAVREIDWTPRAANLGLKPLYRIESLEARDSSSTDDTAPAAIALGNDRGVDLWAIAVPGSIWAAAALPGKRISRWEPMLDGERFEVFPDGDGLAVERRGVAASAGEVAGR